MIDRVLRLSEVIERTGLGRSGIYAAMAAGKFPRQIKTGARRCGWSETEIAEWLEARKAERK